MTRRIGIFGGTFDPPHVGHLSLAVHARDRLALDAVALVVANDPWQKIGDREITPAEHRFRMVELAVEGLRALEASDVEIARGGPSFTLDTVRAVRAAEPECEPIVIVGADAAAGLDTWHRAADLRRECTVGIAARGDASPRAPAQWRTEMFDSPRMDISSTDLRARARAGESLDVLVAPQVIDYIAEMKLYSARGW